MDINLLVQRLQHGESYVVHNSQGEPYQENRPPTQLHIKAAQTIIALDTQLKQLNAALLNVQAQLNQLTHEYESSRTNSPITAAS